MTYQRTAKNSTIQKLRDNGVHDWYRFVLSYPDHLVADMLDYFGASPGQSVLDPFVGTGTTLVECMKQGIESIGIDANPVTAFASQVKTNWDIDLLEFRRRRAELLAHLRIMFALMGEEKTQQLGFGDLLISHPSSHYVFPEMNEPLVDLAAIKALLPAGAISDLPLRKVIVVQHALSAFPQDDITNLFRLALASVAVTDASNLGFGPEVYVKRKKREDADLYSALANKLEKIESDLVEVSDIDHADSVVYIHDARNLAAMVNGPVDYVITSPPYPNEKDYTRTTRLELVLLGFITDRQELRRLKEGMLRSHTRNIFKDDNDSQYVQDVPEVTSLAEKIEQQRIEKGATSGFERLYHRVVTEYFGGMYRVFEQLQHVMPSGGKLAIVVGDQMSYFRVPIRTAALLSIVACRKLPFREIETLLWRTRLATATKRDIEEHILILERC